MDQRCKRPLSRAPGASSRRAEHCVIPLPTPTESGSKAVDLARDVGASYLRTAWQSVFRHLPELSTWKDWQGELPVSGHQENEGSEGYQEPTGLGQGRILLFPPFGPLKASVNQASTEDKP